MKQVIGSHSNIHYTSISIHYMFQSTIAGIIVLYTSQQPTPLHVAKCAIMLHMKIKLSVLFITNPHNYGARRVF